MSLVSSIHTSAPSFSLKIHCVRALSPLFYPMTTAAPSISLDLDTNTPEVWDNCSCEYILPDIIGQLDSWMVYVLKTNFWTERETEKCYVHGTLYFHHCWTSFNRLICTHWRLKTKKENPTYLLPWALCSHVTAGNSKEEHHKPRKKERQRWEKETAKGGSESNECFWGNYTSYKDQSITKKQAERESPMSRFCHEDVNMTA